MLSEINDFVRNHCAPLHVLAKTLAAPWMRMDAPALPAVRRLHGQTLRLHPRFLTSKLDAIESEVMHWMRQSLRSGSTALDIGANVGLHTVYMAKLVGGTGMVAAFEPSPANVRLLRYHVQVNNLAQAQVVQKAVSNRDSGTLPFFLLNGGDHSSNSLTFGRENVPNIDQALHQARRATEVEVVSVDRFCADANAAPDLIKIDVEGAELQVLQGAARTLDSVRPKIILAIHPWWLPPGQTTGEIVAFLADRDYAIVDYTGNRVTRLEYAEYLCEPLRSGK